jgi:carbonic anhydrase/acetyltransferase-like protein (isoleucine patch superfamily)
MQDIDPTAAPQRELFGMITIGADASVWHNAVMRAERNDIRIGRMTNVQDFVMVHADEQSVVIGTFCSVAHHATLHGCAIEDHSLIGVGATLMDGVLIGRGSIVAGGAFVKEGTIVPPASIVVGIPARIARERDCARENRLNAWRYQRNADHNRRGLHRAWDGPSRLARRQARRGGARRRPGLALTARRRTSADRCRPSAAPGCRPPTPRRCADRRATRGARSRRRCAGARRGRGVESEARARHGRPPQRVRVVVNASRIAFSVAGSSTDPASISTCAMPVEGRPGVPDEGLARSSRRR